MPFADFGYFGLLLYPVLPTLVLGLLGRINWRWILLVTLALLFVQYGGMLNITPDTAVQEVWIVVAYGLFEWLIASGFLLLRARARSKNDTLRIFYAALGLSLLPLIIAKLTPLLAPHSAIGFLGISYVTFRSLDVIFGIQDRIITGLSPTLYTAYLFFFPTISSGPIDRYRRFALDWKRARTRSEFLADLDAAIHKVFTGFMYKFILAALIKQHWLDPVASGLDAASVVSYTYAYTFYLFFDFAGYSAFAIGVGYLFGVHTPENFNSPFLARDIRDFWNRWHISLSTWFRDHVYMRFLLAATKGRWFKHKSLASALGFFFAFGLMGFWHGLVWYYILYGMYHATLLSGNEVFQRWNKERQVWRDGALWRGAGIFITFNFVAWGFLLFSGHLNEVLNAARGVQPEYQSLQEEADCDRLTGWAWDRHRPDTPVNVDVYDGATRIATITADLFRADLQDQGKGNGEHGFRYAPDARLKDGKPHIVTLKIAGTDVHLKNGIRTISCPTQ